MIRHFILSSAIAATTAITLSTHAEEHLLAPQPKAIDATTPAQPAPEKPAPDASAQPPAQAVAAVPVTVQDVTTRLQIFLDQKLFGPGKIDGRPGEFVTKALKSYQRSVGLPETGELDDNIPLKQLHPVYAFYEIQKSDLKWIGDVPGKPVDQEKKKYLPYESLLEFLTERYHCAPELIAKLNPTLKTNRLKPGDSVRVPNVEPFKIEELPATGNLPENPQFASRIIRVNRAEKWLEIFENETSERPLAAVPITPGGGRLQTPAGNWKIVGVAAMPTFRWDAGVLNYGKRTDKFFMLPAGPNNPVGVAWIGLSKPGIGIHGTNNPQTIGRAASHGCMRTANWDAIRLSKLLTKGNRVIIQ